MKISFILYGGFYSLACLCALLLYLRDKSDYAISQRNYWRFLFIPWKVITFIIATLSITIIAPYTGDPTWDYCDALFMSVFTYGSAPWSIGVLYKVVKRKLPIKQGFVALCAWLFSASWSYDLYLVLRDGSYPSTWLPNLFASSVLYVSAGLLWNLEWEGDRGVIFAFTKNDWPKPPVETSFKRIVWIALLFIIMVAALILQFVWSTH